jgi:hypothetical protein
MDQAPNYKQAPNCEAPNSKRLQLELWKLRFVWDLEFGA